MKNLSRLKYEVTKVTESTATNVALAGSEISQNATNMQTLKLLSVIMETRRQDAADDIGNFLQGDGTTYGGKAPMGLLGIVDNGSDLANYGGLSRATYTGLNSTLTSTTTISLLKVRTLWNSIADGPVSPNFVVTDYATWGFFEALQTPYQRNIMDFGKVGDPIKAQSSGYREQVWDGMFISRDKKIPTGTFYMLNLDFLHWHALKWWQGERVTPKAKDVKGNIYANDHYAPGDAFTWTGLIQSYNQGAVNGFVILGGQLICKAPFRQGKLYGITGY